MRVGLVCPYSLTLPGGVQGQVLGLGAALRKMGVEARVLGPCDGPPPDASVTPLGNSIPTATAGNGSMAALAPDPAAALRTFRALRDENFDVVHLHEPLVPGPTLTSLLFAEGPMVGTFHRAGHSGAYQMFGPVARWAADHLTLRAAVSEQARATAAGQLGGRYELLWNGIDGDAARRAQPWPKTGPTILFVGRHEDRKGLSVLLEAMVEPAMVKAGSQVKLWVAGVGPDTDRLRAATLDDPRIEWLGRVSEGEKWRRLKGADVFCAPSLHGESFGVVLLEAMAAGAAVVASDLPGYRNVARPGIEAVLVPPRDPGALAEGLAETLQGGPSVSAMVAAGEDRGEHFSLRRLAARYLDLYQRAVSEAEPVRQSGWEFGR